MLIHYSYIDQDSWFHSLWYWGFFQFFEDSHRLIKTLKLLWPYNWPIGYTINTVQFLYNIFLPYFLPNHSVSERKDKNFTANLHLYTYLVQYHEIGREKLNGIKWKSLMFLNDIGGVVKCSNSLLRDFRLYVILIRRTSNRLETERRDQERTYLAKEKGGSGS